MKRVRRVNVVRVYSANFVGDFLEKMRNIIGGRLQRYEQMMGDGVENTKKEFYKQYPEGVIVHVDLDKFTDGAIIVHVQGDVRC
jgi:hypothetical protein